jgi:hypothetical protein
VGVPLWDAQGVAEGESICEALPRVERETLFVGEGEVLRAPLQESLPGSEGVGEAHAEGEPLPLRVSDCDARGEPLSVGAALGERESRAEALASPSEPLTRGDREAPPVAVAAPECDAPPPPAGGEGVAEAQPEKLGEPLPLPLRGCERLALPLPLSRALAVVLRDWEAQAEGERDALAVAVATSGEALPALPAEVVGETAPVKDANAVEDEPAPPPLAEPRALPLPTDEEAQLEALSVARGERLAEAQGDALREVAAQGEGGALLVGGAPEALVAAEALRAERLAIGESEGRGEREGEAAVETVGVPLGEKALPRTLPLTLPLTLGDGEALPVKDGEALRAGVRLAEAQPVPLLLPRAETEAAPVPVAELE